MCGLHAFFSEGGLVPPWGTAGERPWFDIKLPLGAPLLIFPRGYLLKSFPQGVSSERHQHS